MEAGRHRESALRYIDEATVAGVLHMKDLVPVMRRALIDFSERRITQPTRRIMEVDAHGGYFAPMAAAGPNRRRGSRSLPWTGG